MGIGGKGAISVAACASASFCGEHRLSVSVAMLDGFGMS